MRIGLNSEFMSRTDAREGTILEDRLSTVGLPIGIDEGAMRPNNQLPSPDQVITHYRYVIQRFTATHQHHISQHYTPHSGGIAHHITHHLKPLVACDLIRDRFWRAPTHCFHTIPAHVFSNAPTTLLCLACFRNAYHRVERFQCGTCGRPNPFDNKFRGSRQCTLQTFGHLRPLSLHIPLCRRCICILDEHHKSNALIHTEVTNSVAHMPSPCGTGTTQRERNTTNTTNTMRNF